MKSRSERLVEFEVIRDWETIIENAYYKCPLGYYFQDAWEQVLENGPYETLEDYCLAYEHFFTYEL